VVERRNVKISTCQRLKREGGHEPAKAVEETQRSTSANRAEWRKQTQVNGELFHTEQRESKKKELAQIAMKLNHERFEYRPKGQTSRHA
jgi:hypothetical protein